MSGPRLRASVVFGAAAWIVPASLALFVTPIVVRSLGTTGFGLYSYLTGFLAVTFTVGLGRGLIQRTSGNAGSEDAAAWLQTALRLAVRVGILGGLTAAALVAASWSSVSPPGAGTRARVAAAGAVFVAFLAMALFQVLVAVPLSTFRFGDYTSAMLLLGVLQLGGNAVLASAGAEPWVLVLWVAVANVAAGAFVVLRARPSFAGFAARKGRAAMPGRGLAAFGVAVFVYQLSGYAQLLFERWYLGRTLGLDAVAFYAVSMTLAMQLQSGVAFMSRGILPAAAAARNAGSAADVGSLYAASIRTIAPPLTVFVVTLVSLRVEILSLWLGPAFASSASDALAVLAVSFGLLALQVIPWEFLEAGGFPAGNAVFGVAWLVSGVVVDLAAVPRWGVAGAALGRLTLLWLVPLYIVLVERKLFGQVKARLWVSVGALAAVFGVAAAAASRSIVPRVGGGIAGLAAALAACGLLAAAAALSGRALAVRAAGP
ncbi:MAG: hypothetical protein ABIT01_18525 [Thermoanaerobaculia bacterium]